MNSKGTVFLTYKAVGEVERLRYVCYVISLISSYLIGGQLVYREFTATTHVPFKDHRSALHSLTVIIIFILGFRRSYNVTSPSGGRGRDC